MLITMTQDHEDSLNGGATKQAFLAGKSYDLPVKLAEAWVAAGQATPADRPAPRAALVSRKKEH